MEALFSQKKNQKKNSSEPPRLQGGASNGKPAKLEQL
jgi:hypothetical protein